MPPSVALPSQAEASTLEELARADAVALFVQRAHAVDPAFALTEENAAVVAAVCARLDGLPLAIELAAVRLRALSVNALLAILSQRLRVLIGGERDRPGRQQTLRDTIAWSYDLLSFDEQALFRRLAVFDGGFEMESAAAVGATDLTTILDGMTALSDQSLTRPVAGPGGSPRWALLETIREFALQQLAANGEETATRVRHATYFVDLAEQAAAAWFGPEQGSWLGRLAVELDNLRAALTWSLEYPHSETALRLGVALTEFWWLRGDFAEARTWLDRALAVGADTPPDLRAAALYGTSGMAHHQGDCGQAAVLAEACLSLARAHDDARNQSRALFVLSHVAGSTGDGARAVELAVEAVVMGRRSGEAPLIAYALQRQGVAVLSLEDRDRAESLFTEALGLFETGGDQWGVAMVSLNLASVKRDAGDLTRATDLYRQGLAFCAGVGDRWGTVESLIGLADVAAARGDAPAAARLLGVVESLARAIGYEPYGWPRDYQQRAAAAASARLGGATFAQALAIGQHLPLSEAVAVALAEDFDRASALPVSLPPPPAIGSFALSKREREVLALLARRLTDPEIGATLFITTSTASTHVKHVLNKLGVNSRREAAALAARHGLA